MFMQPHNCSFVNSLPEYVLDRTIIINKQHEHQVSGYKLARASHYFKRELIQLRQGEIERSRKRDEEDDVSNSKRAPRRTRARSLCDLEPQPLHVSYEDVSGLEAFLTYVHSSNEELAVEKLSNCLTSDSALSIINAGLFFEANNFLERCTFEIADNLSTSNCWQYWKIGDQLAERLPQLNKTTSNFLLKNFLQAVEANLEGFQALECDQLQKLLEDDGLCCADENRLFQQVEAWIDHHPEERAMKIPLLLAKLRLGRVTHEDLTRISATRYVQLHWEECSSVILSARMSIDNTVSEAVQDVKTIQASAGDVLPEVAALRRARLPYAAIFVVGGWEGNQDDPNFGPSRAIQVYNCRSDTWTREDSALDEGHAYSGCVIHKNCIYVIGGYVATGPTQTLKKLDLSTKAWKYLSPMHEKRNYVSCCGLDSDIYAIGGHNGRHRLSSVERYDTEQNYWTFVAPMRQVRSDAGADSVCGRLYVVGGFDGHHFYDSVEMFDPIANQWTSVAPMQNIRSGVSVVACENFLYAIGGNDGLQRLRTVERYDPELNQWQGMPSMIRQRSNFCVAVLEGEIYVMGGWSDESNSTISLVERWKPSCITHWEPVRELFLPASANCCCSVRGLEPVRDFATARRPTSST